MRTTCFRQITGPLCLLFWFSGCANGCTACADEQVAGWEPGACPESP